MDGSVVFVRRFVITTTNDGDEFRSFIHARIASVVLSSSGEAERTWVFFVA